MTPAPQVPHREKDRLPGTHPRRPRRLLVAVVVASGAILATLGVTGALHDDTTDPGRHSAFTRHELHTTWSGSDRFPLLVPTDLPVRDAEEEIGFSLDNVVTDPVEDGSHRVWVSYYDGDVLGGEGSFRVFQRPGRVSAARPCGAMTGTPYVERRVGDAVITVCGAELAGDTIARDYWETIDFTSALEEVDWLQG